MKAILQLTIVVACLLVSRVAQAVPTFWYNPATGGIYLSNDTGATLGAFSIISAGNNFTTDASSFAAIGGAVFDPGDLPLGFTYLSFPKTQASYDFVFVGNVVKPGTSVFDLSGFFYRNLSTGVKEEAFYGNLLDPEPASGTLTATAAAAFAGFVRRRRR